MRYLFPVLLLTGCAAAPSLPVDYANMSPDQLKQLVADKNATAVCAVVNGPWGKGSVVSVNLDRGTVNTGSMTVDSECKVSITLLPKAP